MPITEMTVEEMQKTAKTHVCGVCSGSLSVAWLNGAYALRCRNLEHNTIVSRYHRRKTEYEKKMEAKVETTALMNMPKAEMITRIGLAKFPQDLTVADKNILAEVAITYGLDPLMGEVSIYQGRPFVSIDGRFRKAQDTQQLDGVETRPSTKEERASWDIPEGDYFFRSEVWRKGSSRPFVGWGRVRKGETTPGSTRQGDTTSIYKPIQSNPQRMAEKRAEAQALRKAFHIPLPSIEDIGVRDDGKMVDVSTGEVIEGTATVIEEPGSQSTSTPPVQEKPKGNPDIAYIIDGIKASWNSGDFLTWVKSTFALNTVGCKGVRDVLVLMTAEQLITARAKIDERAGMK